MTDPLTRDTRRNNECSPPSNGLHRSYTSAVVMGMGDGDGVSGGDGDGVGVGCTLCLGKRPFVSADHVESETVFHHRFYGWRISIPTMLRSINSHHNLWKPAVQKHIPIASRPSPSPSSVQQQPYQTYSRCCLSQIELGNGDEVLIDRIVCIRRFCIKGWRWRWGW